MSETGHESSAQRQCRNGASRPSAPAQRRNQEAGRRGNGQGKQRLASDLVFKVPAALNGDADTLVGALDYFIDHDGGTRKKASRLVAHGFHGLGSFGLGRLLQDNGKLLKLLLEGCGFSGKVTVSILLILLTGRRHRLLQLNKSSSPQVAVRPLTCINDPGECRAGRLIVTVSLALESDEFLLAQEFLAMMLGVQHTGVSAAAGTLRRAGLI
jgi:hypothetical protein